MKKNGFISVSVVYAFFLVFLSLMLFIVTNMAVNRNMLRKMKEEIKDEINDKSFGRYLVNSGYLTKIDIDNSYRYMGDNPNNYVSINNELYRIISVNKNYVKIIKDTSIGEYTYDKVINTLSGKDTDDSNALNTYINNIKKDYVSIFTSYDYLVVKVNSNASNEDIKSYEIGDNKDYNSFITSNISLPLVSDYLYASWLNESMWFLTSTTDNKAYYLDTNSGIKLSSKTVKKIVKPCFYLKKNIKYISGNGTSSQPFIVG